MGLFARRPKLAVDLPPKLAVDEGNLSGTTSPLATDSEPSDQDANSDVASEPAGGGWDASDKSTDSWELVQQQAKAEGEAALEEYAAGLAALTEAEVSEGSVLAKPPPVALADSKPAPPPIDLEGGMPGWAFWGRYLAYPLTVLASQQSGYGTHLLRSLAIGTALRYCVALVFTVLSKLDCFSEPIRISRVNPSAKQHERELDWDGPLILSPAVFVLVDALLPLLREPRLVPLSWTGIGWMVLAHYLIVEPVYYAFHRFLHTPRGYRASHYHHHLSTTTEAISGTSHPLAESLAYLANFSPPFLLPAMMGHFSAGMIPIYFVFFDIMNCIGHCNFECVPRALQAGPLKYIVYTSAFHSLHHTRFKYNYCLFCPVWDYLCGTAHPTSDTLHAAVLSQPSRPLKAVFLGHGYGLASMAHLPWLSPYLASHEHRLRWWLVPLQPLLALWVAICRYLLATCSVQRYAYRGTQCATWCLPVTGHFYLLRSHHQAIREMIKKAVLDADSMGVQYLGLAALNKAEWLNHGGVDLLPHLTGRSIKLVHGNTLTAAAVYHALCMKTNPTDAVFVTGATSKIGRALCLMLASRGNPVVMMTASTARFNGIRAECYRELGAEAAARLSAAASYAEGEACACWVIGKWITEEELRAHVPAAGLVIDYAVPHIQPRSDSKYRYVNGAALTYEPHDTDLTFCHDVPGTVPACLAATIIHASEGLDHHETGEIHIAEVEPWWEKAMAHGFRLPL